MTDSVSIWIGVEASFPSSFIIASSLNDSWDNFNEIIGLRGSARALETEERRAISISGSTLSSLVFSFGSWLEYLTSSTKPRPSYSSLLLKPYLQYKLQFQINMEILRSENKDRRKYPIC